MKKYISELIIVAVILTSLSGVKFTDSNEFRNGKYLLEIYSENGMSPNDIRKIGDEFIISNITGFFEYNDQIISFGISNENRYCLDDLLKDISSQIYTIKNEIKSQTMTYLAPNRLDIEEENVYLSKEEGISLENDLNKNRLVSENTSKKKPIQESYDVSKNENKSEDVYRTIYNDDYFSLMFKLTNIEYICTIHEAELLFDTLNNTFQLEISSDNKKSSSNPEMIVKIINLSERERFFTEYTNKDYDVNKLVIDDAVEVTKNNQSFLGNIDLFSQISSTIQSNPKGGPQYLELIKSIGYWDLQPPANPFKGDRQDRLKQKTRFHDPTDNTVYNWLPFEVEGQTYYTGTQSKGVWDKKKAAVLFSWTQSRLNNLIIDDNEALEVEILFYNYGTGGAGIPGNGKAWMAKYPNVWYSNLPNAYLDTRFMDSGDEKSYAVGTRYANKILADRLYYANFVVNESPENTSRLWQINFQRGYYYYVNNYWYQSVAGPGDEYSVFCEEYETTAKIKQYHKYNSKFYAPQLSQSGTTANYFYDSISSSFFTQFKYKQSYITTTSGELSDGHRKSISMSLPAAHYGVYKFQVDTADYYSIFTSKYLQSKDTTISLYDHDFNLVYFNDDIDASLYSYIYKYFPKGDYYIVVKCYSSSSTILCYLNFMKGL